MPGWLSVTVNHVIREVACWHILKKIKEEIDGGT
jgi:hypothetical protein